MKKRSHAYKCCVSTFSVKILNSFNLELLLKDSKFTVTNRLEDLLTELIGFKFFTTLVLE